MTAICGAGDGSLVCDGGDIGGLVFCCARATINDAVAEIIMSSRIIIT